MKVKLGDVFNLQMGKTPDRSNLNYWQTEDNKWISIADISKCDKYITETKEHISNEAVKETGIKKIPKDTVIMSFKLSIGKTAITTEDCYSNEAIMAFHNNGTYKFNNSYLYHLFSSKDWSEGANKAVKGITLNKESLSKSTITLHTIEEQNAIANKLDIAKKLIIKNKLLLEKYDILIKSRFIEMFGDPVTNPMGWEVKRFKDICDLITDGEHNTPNRSSKGIYLLSARNIHNHILKLEDVDYIDEEEYARISKRIIPQEGDVLISCSGSVGRVCSVPKNFRFQMVRSVALLRLKEIVTPLFMEYLIESDYLQNQIDKAKTQSSQANLFQGKIAELKGFVPFLELQQQFAAFVQQIDKSKFEIADILILDYTICRMFLWRFPVYGKL